MLRNIGSNWFLMVLTGLATFFLMPFNLGELGTEQYGIWLIISALMGYLFLLQLGVPMASVREMTQAIASGDTIALNRVITSCAVLYLGFGFLACLIGIPLFFFFERSYAVPLAMREAARWAFVLSLVQTALGFIAFMPQAILSAHQAFVPKNALMSLAVILRIVVNCVLVYLFPSMATLGIVMLAVTLFELVASWAYVLHTYPKVRPALRHFRAATIRSIIGFSIYVFLMALGSQLAFQTSALVIGHAMTSADVVNFAIPNSLMLILVQFVTGIASVLMPLATNLQTTGNKPELRNILFKWTKITLALSWCAGLFLLIFGPAFLQFWIKKAYHPESGQALRILMVGYLLFLPLRGVAVPMLMGLGQVKWPTLATLAAGALNFILSLLWVGPYGITGVAFAALIPNVLLSTAMAYLICRELGVSLQCYARTTIPLSAIGGAAGIAILGWWQHIWHPSGIFGLGLAGLLTVLVCVSIWAGLVLRHDPHVAMPKLSDVLRGKQPW